MLGDCENNSSVFRHQRYRDLAGQVFLPARIIRERIKYAEREMPLYWSKVPTRVFERAQNVLALKGLERRLCRRKLTEGAGVLRGLQRSQLDFAGNLMWINLRWLHSRPRIASPESTARGGGSK
jgi:hypothetical protein